MSLSKIRLTLHPKTLVMGGGLTALLLLLSYGAWLGLGDRALWLLLPSWIAPLLFIQVEIYYRSLEAVYQQDEKFQRILDQQAGQDSRLTKDYYQIESLFSIFSLVQIRHPLPPMREWAISPDFAKQLIALIDQHQPQSIVEISSGISTVIMGYCLEKIGQGQILSLEHDERFAKISQANLQSHHLQDIATVVYTPLKPIELNGQTWRWYDLDQLQLKHKLPDRIDLLVIDGPPGDLQSLSRYPALPMLFQALSENGVVILDDGDRADEQEIVRRWQQEFGLESERILNEKGAFILRRASPVQQPAFSRS